MLSGTQQAAPAAPPLEASDLAFVDETVARCGRKPDAAIPILQALQEHYRYLPQEALRRVCELTEITPSQLAGVSTFYTYFRHRPAGEHRLRVCHGTACHVKGAPQVQDALERELNLTGGEDTDAKKEFTVEKVACVGCCTLAPVVIIGSSTYGHLGPSSVAAMLQDYREVAARAGTGTAETGDGDLPPPEAEIRFCNISCCVSSGTMKMKAEIERRIREERLPARVRSVGCIGMCYQTPVLEVVWPGPGGKMHTVPSAMIGAGRDGAGPPAAALDTAGHSVVYSKVTPADADRILRRHFRSQSLARRVRSDFTHALDWLLTDEVHEPVEKYEVDMRDGQPCQFLGRQVRIATENFGLLEPLDLETCQELGGFEMLRKIVTEGRPTDVIEEIKRSGLRGRGGAGFVTGEKWALARAAQSDVKYVICNGDEGDPGAFMDRMIMESVPYRVLEGLAIAAYAIGAHDGYLYIRAEYPLAVQRIRAALAKLEERGILGPNMFGGKYALKLEVREGAGAFVCGEETALIASIEGHRGMPRLRPPYPVEKGLWGKPTLVNNVETLALLPWILRHGAPAFAALGTEKSKGTKVFSLAGKVLRGGLIEVPMGTTIKQIVEEIGGGVAPGRTFKAVQIGGPSGGCIPAELCDIPVDYEALGHVGAIMGSGGMVVLDDLDCMVDMARYFLRFTQDQSCGQCTFCRVGTRRMLDILDRLCTGHAHADDLEKLEVLAQEVRHNSLCGLGQTAPNPVLTTLKYFRAEYQAHLEKRCPAGRCTALIKYVVQDTCIGCTKCAQNCPVNAIALRPYQKHEVDHEKCTRCDICRKGCPVEAIKIV